MAEFSYNTNFHSSINMTPFKALYGHEATSVHDYIPGTTANASIDVSLSNHQELLVALKASLKNAKKRMIKQANKHRLEKEFEVDDWVYLKLQPYRQKTVQDRANQKLSRRYFGPYKIVERIGKVAYKLELPPSSKIHPVFHVSLLKPSFGNTPINQGNIEAFNEEVASFLPEGVLDKRVGSENQEQLLVQWENRPLEEATWENKRVLQEQFPFLPTLRTTSLLKGRVMIHLDPTQRMNQPNPHSKTSPSVKGRSPVAIWIKKRSRYLFLFLHVFVSSI
ncbi:uncharacterized protein LOC143536549 [Bidens hawaiensis]|uniref:uncharacterized protein LOC143536549 n=1 Tax=Bidens hawaiensis TaxID=980011 RepID=UPI00404A739D